MGSQCQVPSPGLTNPNFYMLTQHWMAICSHRHNILHHFPFTFISCILSIIICIYLLQKKIFFIYPWGCNTKCCFVWQDPVQGPPKPSWYLGWCRDILLGGFVIVIFFSQNFYNKYHPFYPELCHPLSCLSHLQLLLFDILNISVTK